MSDGEPIDPNKARHGHALAKGEKLHRDTIEVGELLGQGGFGMVYQAHTAGFGKQMVIKEYLPSSLAMRDHNTKSVLPIYSSGDKKEAFTAGLKMFLDEAEILREFEHKNIVRVDDYFEENDTAYMRLEYIKGETLADKLARESRLKERELKDILAGVLAALAYVHEKEHLHRDISPDNIMIREDGTPVLIDFGIARAKFGTAVPESRMGYKKSYSPIEQRGQADGMDMKRKYDPGTDIYALSVVVYEALGGSRPPDSFDRMMSKEGSGQDSMVPAVEALRGLAHENFLKAIDRGLQINLKDRPKSVADFREMLFAKGVQKPNVRKPIDDSLTDIVIKGGDGPQKPSPVPTSFGPSKAAIIGVVIALIALPALVVVVEQISSMMNELQPKKELEASVNEPVPIASEEELEAFLSKHGFASIKAHDNEGDTPLHYADSAEVAALLIQKGADVNAHGRYGKTPLHGDARWGNDKVAALLIQKGADVKARDEDDETPLHEAARSGTDKVATLLIQKGADVKARNKYGDTPLNEARSAEVAALLIKKGADVKTTNRYGSTPLHGVDGSRSAEVVALLIQKGADVNASDKDGDTPLHEAARDGNDKVAALLIQKGVNVNARNNEGNTPLGELEIRKEEGVMTMFLVAYQNTAAIIRRAGGTR